MDITNLCLSVYTEKHKPFMFHFESDGIIGEESSQINQAWENFLEATKQAILNRLKHELE